jgi:putative ABC transport system permease protein
MDELCRDVRYALRILISAPGFTMTAILVLAFGIGANIAMFSVVYGVLFRPLPYHDADRLVIARAEVDRAGANRPVPISIQSAELKTWQQPRDALAATAFYTPDDVVALSGDNGAEVLQSAVVSAAFFSTMGGPLAAGRGLEASDDGLPSAVISERLARRLFGGSKRAIGGSLPLNRGLLTIVGVADRAFQFPRPDVDVWMPAGFSNAVNARCCAFRVIARLETNGTVERARAALRPMFQRSAGSQAPTNAEIRTSVVGLSESLVGPARPAILVLFASVLMVLGIACGNLINVLLARNAGREQEFAIRRALGASAGRLVRQLLVESAILGLAGAACGVLLAQLTLPAFARVAGHEWPRLDAIRLDGPALLFAGCLAVLVTIFTGLTPALRAVRGAPIPNQGAGGAATSRSARRLQRVMCVVQVALALMLIIGATLMGRSLVHLLNVDLGVTTDHVLTASLNLAFGKRPADRDTVTRIDRVIDQLRAIPGVTAVGAGTSLPPTVSRMVVTLRRSGDAVDYQAAAVPATPGYFRALQMRLIKGRFFTDADDDHHPPVMIMSEDTAKRFFGTDDPIGRTMSLPVVRDGQRGSAEMTLVGVTANVKYAGLAGPPDDVVYRPFAQQPWVAPFLVVRTTGDPDDFALTLRRAIAGVDKGIVVSGVTALEDLVAKEAAQPRFRAILLASLAGLALAIAAIGLYGVVAYAVSRRTREIGIRIALGATSREVLTMVLGEGLIVAMAGIVSGTAGALLLARGVARLLYGITSTDPASFLLASSGLFVLTLVATYIPARRAARIEPVRARRVE